MNAEQKQRAVELLAAWRATAYALHADRMADLLQELVDVPEVEPVGYTNEIELFYVKTAEKKDPCGAFWRLSDEDAVIALYTAPPAPSAYCIQIPQSEDQAAAMAIIGEAWLRENAPHGLKGPAPSVPDAHPDDIAVDNFAAAMKAKMAKSRAVGRYGWDDPAVCTADDLRLFLANHIVKGDPIDVGNFAMMLFNRNETTAQLGQSKPEGWLRAIDEALVVHHIDIANSADSYEVAKKKLNTLLAINSDIARDCSEPHADLARKMKGQQT